MSIFQNQVKTLTHRWNHIQAKYTHKKNTYGDIRVKLQKSDTKSYKQPKRKSQINFKKKKSERSLKNDFATWNILKLTSIKSRYIYEYAFSSFSDSCNLLSTQSLSFFVTNISILLADSPE